MAVSAVRAVSQRIPSHLRQRQQPAALLSSQQYSQRRGFHASLGTHAVDNRPILRENRADPPSPEALAAIVDARRRIFGMVEGNGKRSGRKILRRNLYGPAIKSYYNLTFDDMKFDKVGIYAPAREDLYRKEEINKRLGKTRIKGKIRGPSQSFVDRMKIEDAADGVLDQLDWVDAESAIPQEEDARQFLSQLGMTEAEITHFLPILNEGVIHEVERGRMSAEAEAEAATQNAADKKSKARKGRNFRAGRDDKRQASAAGEDEGAGSSSSESDGEAGAAAAKKEPTPRSTEAAASKAALTEKLKPMLTQWREKWGSELERRYKIRVAAEKEMAFQSSKAVGDADAVASPGDARK